MKYLFIIICIALMVVIVGCPKKNKAPDTPTKPSGPTIGQINFTYNFTTITSDPEGNDISYQFYWGVDTSEWSDFIASGESIVMSKSWSSANTYSIKARAKDSKEKISDWSEPHSIVISTPVIWTRIYGGTDEEEGISVKQTSDGEYIVTGFTVSYGAGGGDVYLIKTNTNGDSIWAKTFGGSDEDVGFSVQQTSDGGYIIVGYTESFGAGSFDVYMIKTDANGNAVWTKTFGGINDDGGSCVQQTSDGGYIIVGTNLIKTDRNGNQIWTKSLGTDCYSVQQTIEGGYIIAGYIYKPGKNLDIYLIKTYANGDTTWTRTFGGIDDDGGSCVQQTSDGGYIIAGDTRSFGDDDGDIIIIKTDANGNTILPTEESSLSKSALSSKRSFLSNGFKEHLKIPRSNFKK